MAAISLAGRLSDSGLIIAGLATVLAVAASSIAIGHAPGYPPARVLNAGAGVLAVLALALFTVAGFWAVWS